MNPNLAFEPEVIHKAIFELRYQHGYSFWDRAGRVTNDILYDMPQWNLKQMTGDVVVLSNDEQTLSFAFGHQKLDFSQEQSLRNENLMPLTEFAKLAEDLADKVALGMRLSSFTRIGFRVWHLWPCQSYEEMQDRARSIPMLNFADRLPSDCGHLVEPSARVIIERKSHMLRVAVGTFEQDVRLPPAVIENAKMDTHTLSKNQRHAALAKLRAKHMLKQFPTFGILLDLDAFLDFPPFPESLQVTGFVDTALGDFEAMKGILLNRKQSRP